MSDDGLERLRRWRDEDRGVPPAFGRLDARLEETSRCATAVRLPLREELLLPGGGASGAVTSLLADFALTTAVISSLPDLRGVTTVSMTVDHLALPPTSGSLVSRCTAQPYDDGRPQHAVGGLFDDTGRQVAAVSGWFLAAPAEARSADRVGRVEEPAAGSLLDLLRVDAGTSFSLHVRDALSNALGTLHGGIGALASQLAAEAALAPEASGSGAPEASGSGASVASGSAAPEAPGSAASLRPLTSAFAYLRPTPRDGSVTVTGTAVRRGRRTGTATAALVGPDGRLVLQASLVMG